MILHLCHHWFWITILSVLLTMSAIVKTQEQDMDEVQPTSEPGRTNTSHPPPVRSKLKAALFNVTRLYPVPDNVPDRSLSSGPELTSLAQNIPSPSSASSPSGGGEDNVTTKEADHAGQINTNRSDGDGQPSPDRSDDERHLRFDGSVDVPWSNPEANDDKQSIPDIAVNVENWGVLERIDRTLFASKEVESREFPSQPSDHDKPISPPTHTSTLEEAVTSDRTELLTDSDSSPANANQSERLEREIRKVNATQTVDIEHLPSFQPGSDGSEHGKLNQHTQEFARKISSTVTPLLDTHLNDSNHDDNLDDVKYETEQGGYTIFVTPPSPHTPTPNDLTTQTRSTPTTQSSTIAPVEVVKKSENVSKIRDKSVTEFKAKYSSKIKDKTTPLKPVIVVESSTNFVTPEPASTSTISILSGDTTPVQDLISPTPVLTRTNINTGRPRDYEVMNDSPVAQENATDLALENTSISADYEELNHTSPASANLSSSRSSAHGRMLDVVPPLAHAEDLSNPWGGRGGELNVALISGISFGALALVTLLGAVSFIMYRRYRWNKPQTLSDKCSNPDSSGYIDDSTLRENSEEMYSLDNDSFLNSLEAMTIQNYWTDHVKHTKL